MCIRDRNYSLITNGSVLDTSDNLFKAKVSESEEFIAREINILPMINPLILLYFILLITLYQITQLRKKYVNP